MPDKLNISTEKLDAALTEYRQKGRQGKYLHTVSEIALRAGISPIELVKLAVKNRLKKRVISHPANVKTAALAEYVDQPETYTKAIADKYGISTATLTVWATNAGIPLRSRGLHKLDMPTVRQRQILEMAALYSYEKVGEQFGVSKARVGAIVKRWKNFKVSGEPPFKPGDIILWRKKHKTERLTVIDAGVTHGMVQDSKGRRLRAFPWNSGGRMPRKIGVDPKYVVRVTNRNESKAA